MRYSNILFPVLLLAAACASNPEPAPRENPAGSDGVVQNTETAAGSAYTQTKNGLPGAAMSPLGPISSMTIAAAFTTRVPKSSCPVAWHMKWPSQV